MKDNGWVPVVNQRGYKAERGIRLTSAYGICFGPKTAKELNLKPGLFASIYVNKDLAQVKLLFTEERQPGTYKLSTNGTKSDTLKIGIKPLAEKYLGLKARILPLKIVGDKQHDNCRNIILEVDYGKI